MFYNLRIISQSHTHACLYTPHMVYLEEMFLDSSVFVNGGQWWRQIKLLVALWCFTHAHMHTHTLPHKHTHTWGQISNLVAYLRPNSRRPNQYSSPSGFHQFIAGPLQSADPSEGVWTALWGKQIALLHACISAMLCVPEARGERCLARINYVCPPHRKRTRPQCDMVLPEGKEFENGVYLLPESKETVGKLFGLTYETNERVIQSEL